MLKYWRAFPIWNPQFCCCHSCAMSTSQEFLQGEQLRLSWHLLPPMLLLLPFLFFVFLLVFLWWLWLKLWWCCCWLPCQEIPMMCIYHPVAGNGLEHQQLFDSRLFLVYPRKWNTINIYQLIGGESWKYPPWYASHAGGAPFCSSVLFEYVEHFLSLDRKYSRSRDFRAIYNLHTKGSSLFLLLVQVHMIYTS